jgi:hypothetical protein
VGVVITFSRALVHGPKKFFGIEVPDFYIIQGVAHVKKTGETIQIGQTPNCQFVASLRGSNAGTTGLQWSNIPYPMAMPHFDGSVLVEIDLGVHSRVWHKD